MRKEAEIFKRLFRYDNYRSFLEDFFNYQKKVKACFTKEYFAKKAGFSNHSQISHLVSGRRNLTRKNIDKVISALGLSGNHAEYFKTLVNFNQAKSVEEREEFHDKINVLRKKTKFVNVGSDKVKYFESWHYAVIREIATSFHWKDDYKLLTSKTDPQLTVEEVRKAVAMLEKLGFIYKKNGRYYQTDNVMMPDIPKLVERKSRRDLMMRAMDAYDRLDKTKRHMYACTLGLSCENEKRLKDLISDFEKRFEDILVSQENEKIDKVLHLGLQLFPLSKNISVECENV